MSKQIKWGSIIPLIGGMPVANKITTGVEPSFLLSYDAFAANDSHCVRNFSETPYIVIDANTNTISDEILPSSSRKQLFEHVDFVSTCAPCAGLSMLNSANNGGKSSRGGDAIQNEWLYKSSNFVLENIKPKVLWGENAPNLYTSAGKAVQNKLKEIGDKYGYALTIIKTDTYLHGIPQHRQRTFYFFWDSKTAPLMNYYKKETPHIIDYLKEIPADATRQDELIINQVLTENAWYKYLIDKKIEINTIKEKTILQFIMLNNLLDDAIQWSENSDDKQVQIMNRVAKHTKYKFSIDKGVWDATPMILKDSINALISKNCFIIHPTENRYLNIREALHLMGLPTWFKYDGQFHTITQNVPVKTASDMTKEVIKFINNELPFSDSTFIKQNNKTQKVEFEYKEPVAYELVELF